MVDAIVWQERYTCNFRCPYCTIHSMKCEGRQATPEEWINAFNRLYPRTIDITGGEPFLNKDLVKIINGFDPSINVGLTTNLSQSILEFIQEVSPSKVISMTLSYHPSQTGITRDAFIGKAIMLQSRGFNINVNFVAYPDQMFLIPSFRQLFESIGIRFHIDPYAEPQNKQFKYTEREKQFLSTLVGEDRKFRINDTKKDVLCSGGRNYLQVDPAGNAYRCMTYHLNNIAPIGNILDEGFKLNEKDNPCSMGDICGGCDRDKVSIHG